MRITVETVIFDGIDEAGVCLAPGSQLISVGTNRNSPMTQFGKRLHRISNPCSQIGDYCIALQASEISIKEHDWASDTPQVGCERWRSI
jgi:hypothetical protein